MAYYEYYRSHPKIHWDFLGHMVLRNGGWNMTDLKGMLLSRLLSTVEQNIFLPAFLMYEGSLKREKNLNPYYQKTVLHTLEFKLQDVLP